MKISIQNVMRGINRADIKVRYGIFAGILLAAFALDYFLLMGPQIRSLKGLEEAVKTASADVERVSNDLQRTRQLKDGLNSSRAELEAMSLKVRSLQEVPVILEEISRTANQFNVKIDQVKPLPESQETLISAPEGKYYALPIVIQARSGYHMFGHFLSTLESGHLFFTIRDWHMQADQDAKGLLVQATLKVVLTQKPALPPSAAGAGRTAVFASVDGGTFVYDDHGRRDPFLPQVSATGTVITYEADLMPGDMILEGIVADAQGNNVAVVNGKIVKTGDMIGPYAVAAVRLDNVELVKDGQHSIVRLKKGGM